MNPVDLKAAGRLGDKHSIPYVQAADCLATANPDVEDLIAWNPGIWPGPGIVGKHFIKASGGSAVVHQGGFTKFRGVMITTRKDFFSDIYFSTIYSKALFIPTAIAEVQLPFVHSRTPMRDYDDPKVAAAGHKLAVAKAVVCAEIVARTQHGQ